MEHLISIPQEVEMGSGLRREGPGVSQPTSQACRAWDPAGQEEGGSLVQPPSAVSKDTTDFMWTVGSPTKVLL